MSTKRQSPRAELRPVVPSSLDLIIEAPALVPVPAVVEPVDVEWTVLEDSEPIPHGGQMMTLAAGNVLGERRYGAALIERWRRVYGLKLKRTAG